MVQNPGSIYSAMEDFRRERRMAALKEILAKVTGKSISLLDYQDVSGRLKLESSVERGLRDIPIDAIVGSVGRYSDFTRGFLPRESVSAERWARVKNAMTQSMEGLPPIEVYQLGEVYFVRDGHHRVSVAKQIGAKEIQAYVTEIRTRVPISKDVDPSQLILKTEYANFLEVTRADILLPHADLQVTETGSYDQLEEHIRAHRYFMGLDEKRDISMDEAVVHWYQTVYLPVVQAIRDKGVLREFPGRTETDLYLWISEHRYQLEKELGWEIRSEVAATHLIEEKSPSLKRIFTRLKRRVTDLLVPDSLEGSTSSGTWLEAKDTSGECLFSDLLVPLSGDEGSWSALEQAIQIANCTSSHINGLHVTPDGGYAEAGEINWMRERFEKRCQEAGLVGRLAVAEGDISHIVVNRALLNDIVVINVAHPPASNITSRLSSGLSNIIRRCARPILAVPGKPDQLDLVLVAYNTSLKSREALYLAVYFAKTYHAQILVVCAKENSTDDSGKALREARKQLEARQIQAQYFHERGEAGQVILRVANQQKSTMILMGGYGFSPVVEAVLGSTVDKVLQETEIPVLICQ